MKKKRSGRHATKNKVQIRGPQQLDLRTVGSKALAVWRHEMICHLGGQEVVSVPRRFLVERVVSTELLIQDADRDLMALESTVRDHKYVELVKERQVLVDSQARLLDRLGLDPTEATAHAIPLAEAIKLEREERAAREQAQAAPKEPGVPGEPPEAPNAPGPPWGRARHAAPDEPEEE